jgi:uncharacterized protein (DUF362 family)
MNRREFLGALTAAPLGLLSAPRFASAAGYRVGVGGSSDPYTAATRALNASGEWPARLVYGRTVVIKPNLVVPQPAASGATTDPEVVRAVVDRALASGARAVQIVETGQAGPNFSGCGYDFFSTYDPAGRVALVDLSTLPVTLAPVPGGGSAYGAIYVPAPVLGPDVVYVSVGKLKTHAQAVVSLSVKNQFGLPSLGRYVSQPASGRFAMHDRGLTQSILDLALLRFPHFALVDGVWGMEGAGPLSGNPVEMDFVAAGRNAVAVDRVALAAMQVNAPWVRYLAYCSGIGLGPADLGTVTLAGDPLPSRAFAMPAASPVVEYPRVSPSSFTPVADPPVSITVWYGEPVARTLTVQRLSDENPTDVQVVRTLAPLATHAAGFETIAWDGTTDAGGLAAPGRYAVHVEGYSLRAQVRHSDGVGWVTVSA